jgi:hypothetical protein
MIAVAGRLLLLLTAAVMLLAPAAVQLTFGSTGDDDNRPLRAAPKAPTSSEELIQWPRGFEAYLADHFGLRRYLIRADAFLRWFVFGESTTPTLLPGRNGRIFAAGGEPRYRSVLSTCGAYGDDNWRALISASMAEALRKAAAKLPDTKVVAIPTAPVLYTQDLPAWVEQACRDRIPLAPDLIGRLPADVRGAVLYAVAPLSALPPSIPLIPKMNFHWAGRGARLFIQALAERELGLQPKARAVWTEREEPVELSFAFGRWFMHRVEQPAWEASGIEQCRGASECFRDPAFAAVDFTRGTWRLKRTNGPERLLILGDSFAAAASQGLIDYFDEVVALNLNEFTRAPDDKKDRLWQALAIDWRPTQIIILICDENVFHLPQYLSEIARLRIYKDTVLVEPSLPPK